MMNRDRDLQLIVCDCRNEKYCDKETEKNWSDEEHCFLHPSIRRNFSDHGEKIIFKTAAVVILVGGT